MQLRLDAADRLVEFIEERYGPVVADEAARRLFALRMAPVGTLPPGAGAHLEIEAGLAAARRAPASNKLLLDALDELHLVGTFLRRPPPELAIVPLNREAILSAAQRATVGPSL